MSELFRTVLNMSISGGIVIAVILLARLPLRRAPKKWSYLMWIAAAFRLCCPVSIRSAISLFRVLPQNVSSGAENAGEALGRLSYIPSSFSGMQAGPALPPLAEVTSAPVSAAPAHVTSAPVSPAMTAAPLPAAPAVNPMNVLATLWLAGMAALIIYAAVDYFRTARRVAAATRLEGERNVFLSENVRSPFILGLLRPRILIPYGLSASELSCLLAHEKTHLKRGDHAIKAFAFVLLALHWFNPLCWLAFLLMSRDMELSCDEKVLAGEGPDFAAEYSTTLLSFAVGKRFPAPSPLCFGETAVKERIKNAMKYKKPRLIVTVLALVLAAAVVAACVVNPGGTKPDDSAEPANETPAPTEELTAVPTAGPTAAPTLKPVEGKGVSFTNSLGETVDKLYLCYARTLLGVMVEDSTTAGWPEDYFLVAADVADGESLPDIAFEGYFPGDEYNFDVGAFAGNRLCVLHDVPLPPGCMIELASVGDTAEFTVTDADGSVTRYPAEIYGGDPFTVSARDENILHLEAVEYNCTIRQDSTRSEGFRVDWTDWPTQYDFSDQGMIATVRFVLVELSAEDAARFPALASALEANNTVLRTEVAERLGTVDNVVDREGPADYNLTSCVRRADTRVLSVLYHIWCGDREYYHPEPAEMSARRYESATFDTQTGVLLTPNDVADGIDGGEKYPPHENYAWTYDHDGVSFFINSLETPCCGEFVSIADNPATFNENYLPFTENYIVTLSVIPGGDGLTVVHADGRDIPLRFNIDRNSGYESDGAAWSKITFTVEGADMAYTLETDWDYLHLDRILFVHANGRDYLYLLEDTPNSYVVSIFCVSQGRIFRVCRSYAMDRLSANFTDPMDLTGGCTVNVLGSHYGRYRCAVNCYGIPMRTEWFSVNEEHTVLRALEVRLIGADGAYTGETAVLEPGQKVIFLRTDGDTLEDILLPDGRIARIETDGYYSLSIGGEGVSRYFDNISIWD